MSNCDYQYKTGVYQIRNLINNKIYIGSTAKTHTQKSLSGFYRRFEHHKQALRKGLHSNRHLQKSWEKRGEDNFKFEILATCPPEYSIKLEQWFIDNLKPEYNIRLKAESNLGIIQTIEHKRKRGESLSKNYYLNSNRRDNHIRIKLNVEQVKQIKTLLLSKISMRKCAVLFNVSATAIQYIKIGKTWKDIEI